MKVKKVPSELGGTSIISFVAGNSVVTDRKQIVKLIGKRNVKINGMPVSPSDVVMGGDVVEIYDGDYSSAFRIEVVFEDKNYIIVNKRPGISTSPEDDGVPCLIDTVNDYLREKSEYIEASGNMAYPCNRIEKFSGGLVLFAKTGETFDLMIRAIRERRVSFIYTAIVCGRIAPGESVYLQHYINENEGKPFIKLYDRQAPGLKVAAARVTGLRVGRDVSLVSLSPVTLLRHQLRGQLAVAGHPVLGDQEYGSRKMNHKYTAKHQAIWCSSIVFKTGANNILSYLDGVKAETSHIVFPFVRFSSDN